MALAHGRGSDLDHLAVAAGAGMARHQQECAHIGYFHDGAQHASRTDVTVLRLTSIAALSALLLVACAAGEDIESTTSNVEIKTFEDPQNLLGDVSRRLADNIAEADIGQTFRVSDERMPYPDTYWPMKDDGINWRWNEGQPSPLEKYMALANPDKLKAAIRWNRSHAGKDRPGLKPWFGLCNGWTASALSEAPVRHAAYARFDGGSVQKCSEGEPGCIKFEIGDINALLATVYFDAQNTIIGAHCGALERDIKLDRDGRIDRNANPGCAGLNPGSLLITLAHRIKRDKLPLGVEDMRPNTTAEIWNQPAHAYTINKFGQLTNEVATSLVATGRRDGNAGTYRWNKDAVGFVYVDLTVHWVKDLDRPRVTYLPGNDPAATKTTRMPAVIELDKDPSDPSAKIIGGELVADKELGNNRLTSHPYVWLTSAVGGEVGIDKETSVRSPYVRMSVVKKLAELGRE
jgi:hypothetical protein